MTRPGEPADGDGTRQPRAKPGRDAGRPPEDGDTHPALFRHPGDSGYRGHHGYPCPQGRCPVPGRDSRTQPFTGPRVSAQGLRQGQEHPGRIQGRAEQAPVTAAADRPDHDLHWLGGPCGVRRVDAARPRGRGRGPGAGPQRSRPRPAAPPGRRGPGLPRRGDRGRGHHLVASGQRRQPDHDRAGPWRLRLPGLAGAGAAGPAGLALPAPPGPQRGNRPADDRRVRPARSAPWA